MSALSINKAAEPLSAVLTLSTGAAQTANISLQTYNGVEYTVVPVIAIVEGVLHGANSASPELAVASEFGRFPAAWDGRPVVMNHPQINGVFVSAGSPGVLEEYLMGYMFNTYLDGTKLKCEAWLDHTAIEAAGGEMLETLERIRAGDVVDVSVGAWITVESTPGIFNGKSYGGVWSSVAPDHLAFLSKGTPGACSVADGCGVPRLLSALTVNAAVIGAPSTCCESCADSGGSCQDEGHTHMTVENQGSAADDSALGVPGEQVGDGNVADESAAAEALANARASEFREISSEELSLNAEQNGFKVEAVPGDLSFRDIRTIAYSALCEHLNYCHYDLDLELLTADELVYHLYGVPGFFALAYSVTNDGTITFSGEARPVNLITRIVSRTSAAPNINEGKNDMSGNPTGEGVQPNAVANTGEPTGQPAVNAAPSFDELLAAASGTTRQSIEYGMRMFEARKDELVKGILAVETNKFSEDALRGMDLDNLEGIAALASVGTFAGRAVPQGQEGISTNSAAPAARVAAAPANYLAAAE